MSVNCLTARKEPKLNRRGCQTGAGAQLAGGGSEGLAFDLNRSPVRPFVLTSSFFGKKSIWPEGVI